MLSMSRRPNGEREGAADTPDLGDLTIIPPRSLLGVWLHRSGEQSRIGDYRTDGLPQRNRGGSRMSREEIDRAVVSRRRFLMAFGGAAGLSLLAACAPPPAPAPAAPAKPTEAPEPTEA